MKPQKPIDNLTEIKLARQINKLMDEAFTVPGTNFKFGIDPLLGFVPVAGDGISLVFSGLVVMLAVRKGIDFRTLVKMIGNVVLDFAVGSIPILGNIFDFGYKANRRNMELLEKFHTSGKPPQKAKKMAFLFSVLVFVSLISISVGALAVTLWLFKEVIGFIGG